MAAPAGSRSFYFVLGLAIFLLDQASKAVVARALPPGASRGVIPGLLNLTHVRNRGGAFGLLASVDGPWVEFFLIGFAAAALALVVTLLWRRPDRLVGAALGLILGGALGNLVDRLRAGGVVDFLDFHLGGYHWPAFNLADSAIVLGAAALVVEVVRGRPEKSRAAEG